MTLSRSYPRQGSGYNTSDYNRTTTPRYQEQNHGRVQKRPDITTVRPKWDQQQILRIIMATEMPRIPTTGRRIYDDYQGRPQITSYSSHSKTGSKVDHNRRINVDPEVDCDRTLEGTQAHRRSASQDFDSRSQHTVRSSQPNPCKTRPTETSQIPQSGHYTPTLPRPPTTSQTNTTTPSPRPAHTMKALGDIVFPDGNIFPKFVPRRIVCGDTTFCDAEEDDYPKAYISNILKSRAGLFKGLFGRDEVTDPTLKNRIDQTDDTPLCESTETVVFPKSAQNKEDKWLFVVNQDQYTQGVRVETCVKEGPCFLADNLPEGYTTYCRQKYIYRKMLALNEQGEPTSDSFKLPSCCSCHVKMDPIARMRGLAAPKMSSTKQKSGNRPMSG